MTKMTLNPALQNLYKAAFYYSPTNSKERVLSLCCGSSIDCQFPIHVAESCMSDEMIAVHDKLSSKEHVADLFSRLSAALDLVYCWDHDFAGGKLYITHDEVSRLVEAIGLIYWLTLRGHLAQQEYNGTQFISKWPLAARPAHPTSKTSWQFNDISRAKDGNL